MNRIRRAGSGMVTTITDVVWHQLRGNLQTVSTAVIRELNKEFVSGHPLQPTNNYSKE